MAKRLLTWTFVMTLLLSGGCRVDSSADVSVALTEKPAPQPATARTTAAPAAPAAPVAGEAAAPAPVVALAPQVADVAAPAAPPAAPAAAPAGTAADAVAKVNGQFIPREQLVNLLVEAYGKRMLESVVVLEIVKQQAKAKNITLTPADIAAEEAASYPDEMKSIAPGERQRVLDDYLARHGLTRVHWRMAIERNAYLRRLAQSVPEPKESMLQELFRRSYGEKVEVRHLQVETPADARKAEERLKKGEKFEEVAREMSTDKSTANEGGLMPPFDVKEPALPEEIRSVAFALETPGQVSSQILVRGHYHLLQLVKRIPPANVKFEDVKAKLASQVHDQLVRVQMNFLLRSLPAEASIEILDPVIKKQADQAAAESAPMLPGKGGGGESAEPGPPARVGGKAGQP